MCCYYKIGASSCVDIMGGNKWGSPRAPLIIIMSGGGVGIKRFKLNHTFYKILSQSSHPNPLIRGPLLFSECPQGLLSGSAPEICTPLCILACVFQCLYVLQAEAFPVDKTIKAIGICYLMLIEKF